MASEIHTGGVPVMKRVIRQVMDEENMMLNLEAQAGVPLGSTRPGHIPGELPAERDPTYEDLESNITVAEAAKLETSKPAVRRRFTRNSEHFTQRIMQLVDYGLRDPIQVLMEIATGKEMRLETDRDGHQVAIMSDFKKAPDHKTRVMAAAELASYLYPKRKSVEVTGAEGQPINFAVKADNAPLPEMPSAEQLEAMARERRTAAAQAEKTINAVRD